MKVITTLLLTSLCAVAQTPGQQALIKALQAQGGVQTRTFVVGDASADPVLNNPNREESAAQKTNQVLNSLKIDRTPSGILKTRMQIRNNPKSFENILPLDPEAIAKLDPKQQQQTKLQHLQKTVALLKTDVILGNWPRVKSTLATLPKNQAASLYSRIVSGLNSPVSVRPESNDPFANQNSSKATNQPQYFPPTELIPLIESSPAPLNTSTIKLLANLIGNDNRPTPEFYKNLTQKHTHIGPSTPETANNTANLLLLAGLAPQAKSYLPDTKKALTELNFKDLDLLARYHTEASELNLGNQHLPQAWELSQTILSNKTAPNNYRTTALNRALQLIPKLDEGESAQWLKKTFAGKNSEGYDILSTIALVTSQSQSEASSQTRLQHLSLQYAAANALLKNTDADLSDWSEILTIFLINWNHEANYSFEKDTSTTLGPQAQSDNYGNIFYMRQNNYNERLRIQPIPSGSLLAITPSQAWLNTTNLNTQLEYLTLAAKLYLKVKEEKKAFPLLKKIVENRPNQAADLIRTLINVWAENNNPNAATDQYRSRYSYMYGFNQQAESIPLTRSKQERNLKNLTNLISEIRALKLPASFEKEFTNAFVTAHSTAEVWRLDTLQKVFGPTEKLSPDTVAELVAKMRINLIALWPNPKVQQDAKTKRTDKQLQAQILKGYDLASTLLNNSLAENPESWKLNLQQASLIFEKSNYQATLGSNPSHANNKQQAFDLFAKAAQQYTDSLPLEKRSLETADPFTTWFSAALGAPEIKALKSEQQPTASQYEKIKTALETISNPITAERHQDLFAKALNARLANVAPDLKLRYLYAALPIIGENPLAADAQAIADYYSDLISEIQLDTHVAGSTNLSPDTPFGLHINLRHTREIERESGGFQRYLVNQSNNANPYNFGRPTEDYRDKFEKSLRATLSENFEIISLTFHNSKVTSRTTDQEGWTLTPYAYALLKPKGPQIDSIAPLKIDLDFLDTSGHVIIPITSPAIPISANHPETKSPHRDLKITQILDDRKQENEDQIILEIKATSLGLTPNLEDIFDFPPAGLKVANIEDRKLQIETLDAETADLAPISTHEWKITLEPESGALPANFTFPEPKLELAKKEGLTLQKYEDVDLVTVDKTTPIHATKGSPIKPWHYILAALILAAIAIIIIRKKKTNPEAETETQKLHPPTDLTPVTLLSYLQKIQNTPSISQEQKHKIAQEIQSLQTQSFGPQSTPPTKEHLQKIAQQWQKAA